MNIRHTSYALGFLGAALAGAGTTVTAASGRLEVSTIASAVAADRTSRSDYMKQSEGKFTQWGRKIDQFNREAAQKGAKAKRSAQENLDAAWSEAKQRWADLKRASSDGWEKAKEAYEKSEQKLERAWDDATS